MRCRDLPAAPLRTPVRSAIYTRQSVETHDDLSSCQVQFDLCRSFVQAHRGLGYELIEDRFDDEGYTGATLDRPALQRLLGLLRSGGLDRLVIYRLDRLSRDLRHFVNLGQELSEHKVGLTVVAAPELGAEAGARQAPDAVATAGSGLL